VGGKEVMNARTAHVSSSSRNTHTHSSSSSSSRCIKFQRRHLIARARQSLAACKIGCLRVRYTPADACCAAPMWL